MINYKYLQYNCLNDEEKNAAKRLVDKNIFIFENTLLTRDEQEYYAHYMGDKNNGRGIRNKYAHGTYSNNINTQEDDYLTLLCSLFLIVIRILEELEIKSQVV